MAEATIRAAASGDADAWIELRDALWPGEREAHRATVVDLLAPAGIAAGLGDTIAHLAFAHDRAIGLAEAAIRHDYVNGCDTSPVLFLEGLYVVPALRRRGIARALVERIAAWGIRRGCREFASDAALDNLAGHRLHLGLGFVETERVVCFRRMLVA